MEEVIVENGAIKEQLLPSFNDDHGGVIVELKETMDPSNFHSRLRASLVQWKLQVSSDWQLCQTKSFDHSCGRKFVG